VATLELDARVGGGRKAQVRADFGEGIGDVGGAFGSRRPRVRGLGRRVGSLAAAECEQTSGESQ